MTKSDSLLVQTLVVGPLATNCYLLSCRETRESIIVDPGGDADLVEAFVEKYGLTPVGIISTHGHSDHIAAVAELVRAFGVGFALHGDDLPIVKLSVKEAPLYGFRRMEEPKVDRILCAGDAIRFGSVSGTVIHTPGHTPGGVSLLLGGTVIVGDTLFAGSIGRTDFFGGDLKTLLRSIRNQLMPLPDETVVLCGHGPQTTIGVERRENPFVLGIY